MGIALVTGSAGLIGAASVRFFNDQGFDIVGIDNDMRAYFFGPEASTSWATENLKKEIPGYKHYSIDIRDKEAVEKLFNVEVIKVTTAIVKGKTKRNRFGLYKKSDYKKAFVSISEESEIQFEGIN